MSHKTRRQRRAERLTRAVANRLTTKQKFERFRAQYPSTLTIDEYQTQRERLTPEEEATIADRVAARIHLPLATQELADFITRTADRLGVARRSIQGK